VSSASALPTRCPQRQAVEGAAAGKTSKPSFLAARRWKGTRPLLVVGGLLCSLHFMPTADSAATTKKSARALYEEARSAESRLNRSKKLQKNKQAWVDVAKAYRKVVLAHPRSGYCDDALYYEGEIYRQVDKRFRDRVALRRALDAFLLLIKGYPRSKWCDKAQLARADIYLNRLSSKKEGRKELGEILRRSPKSGEAAKARRVLAGLDQQERPRAGSVQVRNIRHWTGKEYTRIVIDMDREAKFRRGRLGNPDRIYFDLFDTRLVPSLASKTFPIGDGFLKQIRVAQNKPDVVRVVLDFESISRYNVFSLHDPYRLVVDILGIEPDQGVVADKSTAPPGRSGSTPDEKTATPPPGASARTAAESAPPPLPPEPTSNGRFSLSRQLGLAARRVVIDPGHGGHDPGTRSRKGLYEKDVVLDISHRVAKLLENERDFEVIMTRKDDSFVPLEERTAIANSQGADLFVSIHANASRDSRARGIETYYLNLATSPEAEAVAARENALNTRRMGELQDLLRQILNNSKIAESQEFAQRVQRAIATGALEKSSRPRRDRGVKAAPFIVLLGANMPSMLVETSFLSNAEDARLLASEPYRARLAQAIAHGIRDYSTSLKKSRRVAEESPTSQQAGPGGSQRP
ncbi:MAG: N-acetylmuramoyl-L-alanine amidase, partial [Acidobacteriota bacterium]